ncbi:MAG TPA: hypothetical protein VFV87_10665 [Pirellulaceae bacterium]|nr:hypothetical protein [Pirellulaceae bacterium]
MRRPSIISIVLALAIVSRAGAQPGTQQSGALQCVARANGNWIEIAATVMKPVVETKTVTVVNGQGQPGNRTISETRLATESVIVRCAAGEVRAYTAARQPLTTDELLQRLEKETVVFVCSSQRKADAAYASLLKPQTICLFLPTESSGLPDGATLPAENLPPLKALPGKLQPTAGLATITKDGQCVVRQQFVLRADQTAMRTVESAEGSRQAPYSIKQQFTTESLLEFPASEAHLLDQSGQRLDAADAAAALANEIPVLIATDGRPVDPAFLTIVRPEALVLVLPTLLTPAGQEPAAPLPASPAVRPGAAESAR